MPPLAEKLMSKGEIKGKQDLLIKQLCLNLACHFLTKRRSAPSQVDLNFMPRLKPYLTPNQRTKYLKC